MHFINLQYLNGTYLRALLVVCTDCLPIYVFKDPKLDFQALGHHYSGGGWEEGASRELVAVVYAVAAVAADHVVVVVVAYTDVGAVDAGASAAAVVVAAVVAVAAVAWVLLENAWFVVVQGTAVDVGAAGGSRVADAT